MKRLSRRKTEIEKGVFSITAHFARIRVLVCARFELITHFAGAGVNLSGRKWYDPKKKEREWVEHKRYGGKGGLNECI